MAWRLRHKVPKQTGAPTNGLAYIHIGENTHPHSEREREIESESKVKSTTGEPLIPHSFYSK